LNILVRVTPINAQQDKTEDPILARRTPSNRL
jgi:hypothetical protein